MLKNDILKNGTSRIGLYGSVPPGDFVLKLNNKQPLRFNLNDEFCRPVLPHNQILCLHDFNLRSLYFQVLQSLPNWIQLQVSGTSAIRTPFQ